jgi:LacI family transcriptional regulator
VAIIGVDNDELACELAIPPLSSIAQNTEQMGFRAAKLLDALMTGRRRRPVHVTVGPNCLVTRPSSDRTAVDDVVVSKALQFVREHAFDYLIGVPEVVRHVGVSRSTLEIRFKRHLNCTIHEEILRIRLSMARRLLTSTELSLNAIAERTGFRTPDDSGNKPDLFELLLILCHHLNHEVNWPKSFVAEICTKHLPLVYLSIKHYL